METVIPFKLVNGIILLDGAADGEEGQFIFDTGAMKSALNGKYFDGSGGETVEIAKFNGEMSTESAKSAAIQSLAFPGLTFSDPDVMLMDLAYVEDSLTPFDGSLRLLGLLGNDLLRRRDFLLDYESRTVALDPEGGFESFTAVPMNVDDLITVELEIRGERYGFVLDTGANTCLLDTSVQGRFTAVPDGDTGVYTVPRAALGGREYRDIPAVFTDLTAVRERADVVGIVGYSILSEQRTVHDFTRQTLWLERK